MGRNREGMPLSDGQSAATPGSADASAPPLGLQCRDLWLVRDTPDRAEREILRGISASFEPATLTLISGAIGSGKTTLLHVLSTLLRPTSGEVWANGQAVSRYSSSHRDAWRRNVGIAFQSPHFLDELTALENVMLPLVPACPSLRTARERAAHQLEQLGVPHLAARAVSSLSGGERQRVTLARALVRDPGFLFVDEPSAHQDGPGTEIVLGRLSAARARGATLIVVSHDERLHRAGVADRDLCLSDGLLVDRA